MNRQDVFAGAQVVTQHPILAEGSEVRCQYYAYLKRLIKCSKQERRKYSKAQLAFYQNALCVENVRAERCENWRSIRRYCYLLPFDVAAVLGYNKNQGKSDFIFLVNQISRDFDLADEAAELLHSEFSAALGDDQAWDDVLHERKLSRYRTYLRLVKNNLEFIQVRPYNILITATMSAGKSTLINALVGKNISLMQNLATTSKIHIIISKPFDDGVTTEYDSDISLDATKDELLTDNEDNRTSRITVSTYFDGLLCGQRMILYDSPGVNSSKNPEHTAITNKMIRSKKYKLLVYVLNATQLSTTDEEQHLVFVAKTVGRQNILFVMNKIDHLISEDESLSDVIMRQRDFLKQKGFKTPIICPVSARAAFLAKRSKKGQLSRLERREIENYVDKFAQSGLREYYEEEMGCPPIWDTGDEIDNLYRNCGFAYLEKIIIQYKKEL